MTEMTKYIAGFGLSFAITSLFSAILVVLKETNQALLDWMKAATGHHWVTQGVLVITLFVALGLIFSNIKLDEKLDDRMMLTAIISTTIIGGLIIIGFYLIHI